MHFAHSDTTEALIQRLNAFLEAHVWPAEAEYTASLRGGADWR